MKRLIIILLAITINLFAGKMHINYNSGEPLIFNYSDIDGIEFVENNMILVESGIFQMGSTTGTSLEKPVHQVSLNSYSIGQYEVTQNDWIAVMGTNPAAFQDDLNKPVDRVSWYEVLVYSNKRSIAEGLMPCYTISGSTNPENWGSIPTNYSTASWNNAACNWSANGYRMPTEAEWEFTARGGNNSRNYLYSGSDILAEVGWYKDNSDSTTHVVGLKQVNELDCCDMSGNVYEWCWDWIGAYNASNQTNPTGPNSPTTTLGAGKVFRGGDYHNTPSPCRSTYRGYWYPNAKSKGLGFRLARTL